MPEADRKREPLFGRRSEHSSQRAADKTTALVWITGAQFTADTRAPVRFLEEM